MLNLKSIYKILFKTKSLIFWTLGFPIIMATLFYAAFSGLDESLGFSAIKIAVVENQNSMSYNIYKGVFNATNDIDAEYVQSEDEAKAKLDDGEIVSYLKFAQNAPITDAPTMVVKENGTGETIVQNIITEVSQSIAVGRIVEPANIKNISTRKINYAMIEYFSLIAMTCLYGGMMAMSMINRILANMSMSGRRIAVSATPKSKLIISTLFACYTVQLVGLLLVFSYMNLVLGINFGEHAPAMVLLSLIGAITGLSLGVLVASLFRTSEENKNGILTGFTMLGCFFAGMMGPDIKLLVDTSMPIINLINPSAMITDGFYAIINYGVGERYWFKICSLLTAAIIMTTISVIVLRRQKYDSL